MNWFLETLAKEWATIKAAPLSFIIVVALSSGVLFVVFKYIYSERLAAKDDMLASYRERLGLSPNSGTGPDLEVSDNTITPTHSIHHVRPGLIKNIGVPAGFNSGVIYLIPDGIFTTDTSGNIRNSFAASTGQVVLASYDGRKWSLLQSPFADTGDALTTSRDLKAATVETTSSGDGKLELFDSRSKQWLKWSVGQGPPEGACITGSLYSSSSGGAGNTLYVCEKSAWVAK